MKETAPKLSATDTFGLGPTLTLMFAHYRRSWDESKKWQQISLGFFLVFFFYFLLIESPKIIAVLEKQQPSPSQGRLDASCLLAKTMQLEFG